MDYDAQQAIDVAAKTFHEVSAWASKRRDGIIISPLIYTAKEAESWRRGYYEAMNDVAQHFNIAGFTLPATGKDEQK